MEFRFGDEANAMPRICNTQLKVKGELKSGVFFLLLIATPQWMSCPNTFMQSGNTVDWQTPLRVQSEKNSKGEDERPKAKQQMAELSIDTMRIAFASK
jgi:hypothetical protein